MTKQSLRKEYLIKRMALPNAERLQLQNKITERFTAIRLPTIEYVLSYIALATKGEIAPAGIEKKIIEQYKDCQLCYPKIEGDMGKMEGIIHADNTLFIENKWGVDEPVSFDAIDPPFVDLILVPLLAFDKFGYRVGYGKGFYDRYIARCRQDVITIGLSFFEPVDCIDDVNEYDKPLNYCITPEQLYTF